jgi:hypothetical protein
VVTTLRTSVKNSVRKLIDYTTYVSCLWCITVERAAHAAIYVAQVSNMPMAVICGWPKWSHVILSPRVRNFCETMTRPCHDSGSQSLVFHTKEPGLIPGQSTWNCWGTKLHALVQIFLTILRSDPVSITPPMLYPILFM